MLFDDAGNVLARQFGQDLRYAARGLRRSPIFTLTAVIVLSLGIGVNLTELAAFRAIEPAAPARHQSMEYLLVRSGGGPAGLPLAAFTYLREHNKLFHPLVAEYRPVETPSSRALSFVSDNYFADLGPTPLYGRLLDPADGAAGAQPVAVLGFDLWQQEFGSDPGAIGKSAVFQGQRVRIVGVLPAPFRGLDSAPVAAWLPLGASRYASESPFVAVYARLRPEVSSSQVEPALDSLSSRFATIWPADFGPERRLQLHSLATPPAAKPNSDKLVVLGLFSTLVLLVLVVACADLANLLLARGAGRQDEIRFRRALGATRGRLIRQLMTENLLLALVSGAAVLLVGWLGTRWIGQTVHADVKLDWATVAADFAISLFAALIFGLLPAFETTRFSRKPPLLRKILIGAQVTITCVLLILGGMLTKSLQAHLGIGVAFDPAHILAVDYGHASPLTREQVDDLVERLRHLPDVESAATTLHAPLLRSCETFRSELSSKPACIMAVDASYFATIGLPLLGGRTFAPGEKDVLLISQSAAAAFWHGQDAIGRKFTLPAPGLDGSADSQDFTVIGIVPDSGANIAHVPGSVEMYRPIRLQNGLWATILLRTRGDAKALIEPSRSTVLAALPGVTPVVAPLRDAFYRQNERAQFEVLILDSLAGVSTLFSAVGLVGLVIFSINQQVREIGIRIALGATRYQLLQGILRQYMKPVLTGATLAVPVAWLFAQAMGPGLYGTSTLAAAPYLAGCLIFCAVALLATVVPAIRALRLPPAISLRRD